MTVFADHKKTEGKISRVLGFYLRVGVVADVGMAICASDLFSRMDGVAELRGIDRRGDDILAELKVQTFLLMASETKIVSRLFILHHRRGLC